MHVCRHRLDILAAHVLDAGYSPIFAKCFRQSVVAVVFHKEAPSFDEPQLASKHSCAALLGFGSEVLISQRKVLLLPGNFGRESKASCSVPLAFWVLVLPLRCWCVPIPVPVPIAVAVVIVVGGPTNRSA